MPEDSKGLTRVLAGFISGTRAEDIPGESYEHAQVAFLDWLAVAVGGKDDPLVSKLIAYADAMGGHQQATVIGHNAKKSAEQAALINGASSHALDYDDTMVSFFGHPSVVLFPALLSLAEWKGKSGKELLAAYLIGLQTGATVGASAGMDHYLTGWHATSTIGHLAASAACAALLDLDADKAANALGIGATQSSGLKRVFGTDCKPLHAGIASQAGLMAGLLAEEGFTSAPDILEGPQGFFQAFKGQTNEDMVVRLGEHWDVPNLAQKYHASCHATHSPIEAAMAIVQDNNIGTKDIKSIKVHSSKLATTAAYKEDAETGLEGKFCIPYCVANALLRGVTGYRAFTDEMVNDAEVRKLMDKLEVVLDDEIKALESRVEVVTEDGRVFEGFSDILQQIPPLEMKKERIREKFFDLCEPVYGRNKTEGLANTCLSLQSLSSIQKVAEKLEER